MTKAEAMELMALLAAAFPRQALEPATLRLYAEHIAVLDREVGRVVIDRLITTSRFFPTIAEIRGEVAAMTCDEKPSPEDAWGEVCSELRRVGHTRSPEFSCPEVWQAVRAVGGWMHLCLQPTNASDRARFIDAYRSARERAEREAQYGDPLLEASTEAGRQLRGETSALGKLLAGRMRLGGGESETDRAMRRRAEALAAAPDDTEEDNSHEP